MFLCLSKLLVSQQWETVLGWFALSVLHTLRVVGCWMVLVVGGPPWEEVVGCKSSQVVAWARVGKLH